MAQDNIHVGAPTINQPIHITMSGAEKVAALFETIKQIAKGTELHKYWADQAEMIQRVTNAYKAYQREVGKGLRGDRQAEELIKTFNALQGRYGDGFLADALGKDSKKISSLAASLRKEFSWIDSDYSSSKFNEMFDVIQAFPKLGKEIRSSFEAAFAMQGVENAQERIERLESQLLSAKNTAERLRDELDELRSGSSLEDLQSRYTSLIESSKAELLAFFKTAHLPEFQFVNDEPAYSNDIFMVDAFNAVAEGAMTADEAIRSLKATASHLFSDQPPEASGVLSSETWAHLTGNVEVILQRVEALHERFMELSADPSRLTGGMDSIGRASAEMDTSSIERLLQVIGELTKAAEEAPEPVKNTSSSIAQLVTALGNLASSSNEHALEVTQSILYNLRNLSSKDFSISSRPLNAVVKFAESLQRVGNITNVQKLSGLDLSGFAQMNDLNTAPWSRLARYLQALSLVDAEKLHTLSKVDFSKLAGQNFQVAIKFEAFDKEGKRLDELNGKFKEHAKAVETAVEAERKKLEISKELTVQLASERDALDGTATGSGASADMSSAKLTALMSERLRLQKEIERSRQSMDGKGTNEQQAIQARIDLLNRELQLVTRNLDAYRTSSKYQKQYQELIQQSQWKLSEVEAKAPIAQGKRLDADIAAWNQLEKQLSELGSVEDRFRGQYDALMQTIKARSGNIEDAREAFKGLSAAIREHEAAAKRDVREQAKQDSRLASSSLTYDKLTNKLTSYFHQFEREISRNPTLMNKYQQTLNSLNTQAFGQNMTEAAAAVQQFQLECEKAGVTSNTFIKRLVSGFGNKLMYGGLARMAMYVRRLAREIYNSVKEIDAALAQLKIVTGATEAQMTRFLKNSAELATKLGKSVSDVLKSVETFSRLGYNLGDASQLAEYATILSNVANVDVSAATTGLTSIIKAFGLQVSDSEHVADVLVNVGQKYAISAEELMSAFERGGASLAASNTSFDQAAAIFAAANASMQNAEKVGTAVQTISARIRGAKSELEDLGEDYEDIAEGVSKYRDEIKALTNVTGKGGIDVYADAELKKYKDIYTLLTEIAGVWDQIDSDASRQRIAEIFGGNRQYSVFSSIVKNIADAEKALNTALNSAGAAMEANDIYMESIQGRVGALKADFQMMSNSFLNSGMIKAGVSILDFLVKTIKYLSDIKLLLPGIVSAILTINAVGRPENEGFSECAHLSFAREGYISERAA